MTSPNRQKLVLAATAIIAVGLFGVVAALPAARSAFAAAPAPTAISPTQQVTGTNEANEANEANETNASAQIEVRNVQTGSPAEKAGLKQGDVIVAIDGKAVTGRDDLSKAVAAKKSGDILSLDVQDASGAKRTVSVTLADNPNKAGTPYIGIEFGGRGGGKHGSHGSHGGDNGGGKGGGWMNGTITQTTVISVVTGSPAEKAGLKQGDVIVAIDGKAIATSDDLPKAIAAKKPGDTLSLDVQDATGAKRTVAVTLGDTPNKAGTAYLGIRYGGVRSEQGGRGGGEGHGRFGYGTGPITIAEVQAGSPAAQAGLLANDVITEVNGTAVSNLRALMQTLATAKVGDKLTLKVMRGTETKTIEVTVGDNPNQKGKPYLGISVSPAPMRIPVDQNNKTPITNGVNS